MENKWEEEQNISTIWTIIITVGNHFISIIKTQQAQQQQLQQHMLGLGVD